MTTNSMRPPDLPAKPQPKRKRTARQAGLDSSGGDRSASGSRVKSNTAVGSSSAQPIAVDDVSPSVRRAKARKGKGKAVDNSPQVSLPGGDSSEDSGGENDVDVEAILDAGDYSSSPALACWVRRCTSRRPFREGSADCT